MTRIIATAVLAILTLNILVAETQKETPSTIKEVTVFRQGAQVLREGKASLAAGRSVLVFSGLSPQLDPKSVQVGATGDFMILSVNHKRDYLKGTVVDADIKALQNQLIALQDKWEREQALMQVAQEEESLILANKSIGGQQNGVSIQELRAAAEFYRARLAEIKLQKIDINKRMAALQEDISKIQGQLNEVNARRQGPLTSEIWVTVDAEAATQATFRISYLVNGASWTPQYDLRVKDISQPVKLTYKADISQSTGEDWNDVKLTLSTGNPTQSGARPSLQPWWLAPAIVYQLDQYRRQMPMATMTESAKDDAAGYAEKPAAAGPVVTQQEKTTTVEFRIETRYDIPSNGLASTVAIANYELPATYEYYAVPKLDRDAFLTALVTNWEQYNLLSGAANLFFEDTFVGQTVIDVSQTRDTLLLSLGRDKSVNITRTKQKQYANRQFIGNKTTETIGWEIAVRNKKKQAVKIIIDDQYPISTNDEIEVKLETSKGANVDPEAGKLTWTLELKPGESRNLEFRYAVKYPKKMNLNLE